MFLLGSGGYNANNYTLTIGSPNLMRSKNSDTKGTGGAVVISGK